MCPVRLEPVETIVVEEWKELNQLDLIFHDSLFRGQADADWGISSSLARKLDEVAGGFEEDKVNTEFWMLREFKKRAQQYASRVPREEDVLGWLALMQHHGAPTRLIDFTHSFYVACYFALADAKKDAAIWAIDAIGLNIIGCKVFKVKQQGFRDQWDDDVYEATNRFFFGLLSHAQPSKDLFIPTGVVAVEPLQHNQRMGTQQGLFVVPLDINKSLLDNLKRHPKHANTRKIVLRRSMREEAMAHLAAMNITAETLFPGLDGYAKSITHKVMNA